MLLATGCLDARCLDGGAIRDLLGSLGLSGVLLVTRADATPARLAGLPVHGVRAPLAEAERGVEIARAAGATRLILEPDEADELETLAPWLHAFGRAHPGLSLAVRAAAGGPLARLEPLELLLDDLAGQAVGYWHRPSRVAVQGDDEVRWLDRLGRYIVGASLDDLAAGELGLPPGLGEIDFARTATLLGRSVDVALDTDPLPEPGLLGAALVELRRAGFP